MRKLQRFLPAKWWSSFLWIVVSYIVFADILPNLLLILINCSGYLPYSDRPGPGWQPPHLPSKDEMSFFFGFAYSLVVPTAVYAAAFGVIGLLIGFCSLPRWVTRLIGSPLAFIASGFMMMAAGWMIAISAVGIYTAAICGLIWGLLVLPLLVVRRALPLPMWARVALPLVIFSSSIFYLVRPFLPHTKVPGININLARCNDAGAGPLVSLQHAFEDDANIRQAGLSERSCHLESAGQTSSSGTSDQTIQIYLLFLKPTNREVDVPVPEKDGTLVVIDGDSVRFVPDSTSKNKEILRIREDASGKGFSMKDDGYGRMDTWLWNEWSPETGYGVMDMRLLHK